MKKNYLIRAAALTGFEKLVTILGGDAIALMKQVDLTPEILKNKDRFIAQETFVELLELAAMERNCEVFGLMLGRMQSFSMMGILGFVIQHSPDLKTALDLLIRYNHTHNQGSLLNLDLRGDEAQLTYTQRQQEPSRQNVNLSMTLGYHSFQTLLGSDVTANAVYFYHDTPKKIKLFHQTFQAPLYFNQEFNGVVFDKSLLKRPINKHDRELYHFFLSQIQPHDDFSAKIEDQIEPLIHEFLPTGICSIERVARSLGMSRSSLNRRLKEKGTTFKRLLEEVRQKKALKHIKDSNLSLEQVALMLGYSGHSALTRAYKKWFNVTPKEVRSAEKKIQKFGNDLEHSFPTTTQMENGN